LVIERSCPGTDVSSVERASFAPVGRASFVAVAPAD
jgi:hypothetical protein